MRSKICEECIKNIHIVERFIILRKSEKQLSAFQIHKQTSKINLWNKQSSNHFYIDTPHFVNYGWILLKLKLYFLSYQMYNKM